MIMFLCVVICIMEYDNVSIFQILFCHAKIGMNSIQGVHPSTVCAILLFSKFCSVCFGNRCNIIARCIFPGVFIICEYFCHHIKNCGIATYFVFLICNPGLQIIGTECMDILVLSTMDFVTKKLKMDLDILRIFFQDFDRDLYTCAFIRNSQALVSALFVMITFNSNVRYCNVSCSSVTHLCLNSHTCEVKVLTQVEFCTVVTGDFQLLYVKF